MSRHFLIAAALVSALLTGCGGLNVIGRQPCWPEADDRTATTLRGRLDLALEAGRGTLTGQDGRSYEAEFPFMTIHHVGDVVVLTDEGRTVALSGETVTVFGGLGPDGDILVCSIELEGD